VEHVELYHGSSVIVEKLILLLEQRALDFGSGFYTTTNKAQAEVFARKVGERRGAAICYVSVYEIADIDTLKKELSVLDFAEPNDAWLDFVFENRANSYNRPHYDIVRGPVAPHPLRQVRRHSD
jgi:hypothetical protein